MIPLVNKFTVLAVERVRLPVLTQPQQRGIGFKQLASQCIGGFAIDLLLLHRDGDTGQGFGHGKTDTQFNFNFFGIGLDDGIDQGKSFFYG
ncbi:hypothetical protein D3C87_1586630 [compost metagenome]